MIKSNFSRGLSVSFMALLWTGCCIQSDPDLLQLRIENNARELACIYNNAEVPAYPLTLDDIIAIANERNLNLVVKAQEYEIQREVATREKFHMLPGLKGNLEESYRTKNTASSSESLVPGVPPAPLSISSEQHVDRWDIGLVWNLLDFGLSYYRSRQEYNRSLMTALEYERQSQNLVVDITREYWKGIAAKQALKHTQSLVDKALNQQTSLNREIHNRIISEIQGLRNINQLVNLQIELQKFEKEYHSSKYELAILMGLPASIEFELADVEFFETDVLIDCIDELEQIALISRPELYSADIDQLIKADDVRVAILQMFPNVELFDGRYHDGNRFLLHKNWMTAGVRATWNLLDIPGHEQERWIAYNREELIRKNRMALSIGIIAQLHLAYHVYFDNVDSYKLAKELESINQRLLTAARNEQKQGKLHEADILKYEAELLFSQVSTKRAYGEVENSLEQLNNAMGRPQYFRNTVQYGEDGEDKAQEKSPSAGKSEKEPDHYYEPTPATGTKADIDTTPESDTGPLFISVPPSAPSSINSLMPPPLQDSNLSPRPTLPPINVPAPVPIQGTPAPAARPVHSEY